MGMFGKKEPEKASRRLKSFPDGSYIVRAWAFMVELRNDKTCHKIQYNCLADRAQVVSVEPGTKGEYALFPGKDVGYTYVAADLANYFGAAVAAELGLAQRLDEDMFVMNADSRNGGTPVPTTKKDGATVYEKYPALADVDVRRAWLNKYKDDDGKWSVEELIGAEFKSTIPLVLTVETRQNTKSDGSISGHTWDLLTDKMQAWYRAFLEGPREPAI